MDIGFRCMGNSVCCMGVSSLPHGYQYLLHGYKFWLMSLIYITGISFA